MKDFSIHNLPFGIFSTAGTNPRAGIAFEDKIVDLPALAALGFFEGILSETPTLAQPVLNDFIRLGKKTRCR